VLHSVWRDHTITVRTRYGQTGHGRALPPLSAGFLGVPSLPLFDCHENETSDIFTTLECEYHLLTTSQVPPGYLSGKRRCSTSALEELLVGISIIPTCASLKSVGEVYWEIAIIFGKLRYQFLLAVPTQIKVLLFYSYKHNWDGNFRKYWNKPLKERLPNHLQLLQTHKYVLKRL
jgi:hypothetical protein